MGKRIGDSAHLIRPAVVIVVGLALFLGLRQLVIPKDFGKYGHFRPGALDQIRQRPVAYAGQDQCLMCHVDQGAARSEGKHAHVACEACHGALAKHAEDPTAVTPKLPDVATLCATCHEKDAAKPAWFPQVASAEHSSGMKCNDCHKPHNPKLGG
jgi:uncharacterized CHY-type Zn-finger protein